MLGCIIKKFYGAGHCFGNGEVNPYFPCAVVIGSSIQNIFCSTGNVIKYGLIHISNDRHRHGIFIRHQDLL